MANVGVKGRIIYADKTPEQGIPGLQITAVDFDPFFSADDILGHTETDEFGNFEINYSADDYSLWGADEKPDIVVRVYNKSGRLLHETAEAEDVVLPILPIPTIKIHENHIDGWLVTHATLNLEDGSPVRLSEGNKIEFLLDGASMFPAITQAVENASSVNLMTLGFEVGDGLITEFTSDVKDYDPDDPNREPCATLIKSKIDEELKKLAQNGSNINIMVNDIPLSDADSIEELDDFYKNTTVELRDFNKGLSLLHSKNMIVDGAKAFVMGSPISNRYFSDGDHFINDIRHRGSLNHDVSLEVTGPAVNHIDQTFKTIWKATKDPSLTSITPLDDNPPLTGDNIISTQVLRTMPGAAFKPVAGDDENLPHGETGILEAYQRAISLAERYIYIENQYFTSPEIADALIHRIKDGSKPKLQIILVLNFAPDLPGYPKKQIELINQIKLAARSNGHKFGVYTLWSRSKNKKDEFEIMNIYVHSKLAIIDDKWATIGSANLDGTSLNYHQIELMVKSVITDAIIDAIKPFDEFNEKIFLDIWKYIFWLMIKILLPFISIRLILKIILVVIKIIIDRDEFDKFFSTLEGFFNSFARLTQHANPNRTDQPPRSIELNLFLYSEVANQPQSDLIKQLRNKLWQEHLGMDTLPAIMQTVPSDIIGNFGWVDAWDNSARTYLEAIKNNNDLSNEHAPKILPWQPETNGDDYLSALKVRTKNLKTKGLKFDFKTCNPAKENTSYQELIKWLIF